MNIFIPIISAICMRLGGWGAGDSFLPFYPFTKPSWKIGGRKFFRWFMGVPIALITGNWWLILTYYIATSGVPYGENSWTAKLFGHFRWFVSGAALGMASLEPVNALWMGCVFMAMKFFDTDQAYFEVLAGCLSTLIFLF